MRHHIYLLQPLRKANLLSSRSVLFFLLLTACLLVSTERSSAQWTTAGMPGFSAGNALYTSLAIAPDGTPYIGYEDGTYSSGATVKKFTNGTWQDVGTPGFSAGAANFTSLAIAPDGTPYIGYEVYYNGVGNRATVKKFSNGYWQDVGTPYVSAGDAYSVSLVIAPDGTPYIGYMDGTYSSGATVKKFTNGTWQDVGMPGFSAGTAIYTSLALALDGTPYIGYKDESNGSKATVKKFSNGAWQDVGTPGFSAGAVNFTSLAIAPDGTPYIGYEDDGNGGKATVKKFSNGVWQDVGMPGFSAGNPNSISLAIAPAGTPYIGYTDYGNNAKATVMRYASDTITTQSLSSTTFCADSSQVAVRFTATGYYNADNVFTAQLSDRGGNFNGLTTNIGTLAGTASGTIQAVLPVRSLSGTNYRIRVVAGSPAVTGTDNGQNLTINGSTLYYLDSDNDSYGDPAHPMRACSQPQGYVANGNDCDDINANVNPYTVWVLDEDGDGYYIDSVQQCAQPDYRWSVKNTRTYTYGDCNDTDAGIHSYMVYYHDADGDGYGAATDTFHYCSSSAPQGYTTDSTDCNDGDKNSNPNTLWVKDADNDGYYGDSVRQCTQPAGYVAKGNKVYGDCNDADAGVHAGITYYVDGDRDGYGSTTTAVLCASNAPAGYATNNTDCNDADAAINPATVWVLDADRDGYYTGNPVAQCTSPGTGYVIKANQVPGDCNDNDNTVHAPQTYYVDSDKDGYGSAKTALLCASSAPVGYSTNNTDCNDSNAAINPKTIWVLDADGDKYYITGSNKTQCTLPGAGYVLLGTTKGGGDCNDGNAAVNPGAIEICGNKIDDNCNGQVDEGCQLYTFYQDYDKDGYGNPKVTITGSSSAPPAGYVANNLDCDDRNKSVHPGAYDGYDGIDNDCDGQTDEDFFQISICDAKMYEGNTGQCYMLFVVSLNWLPCRNITVNYTTQDGTATTANKDYAAVSGKLTFYPGYLIQTIAVPVNGDKVKEGDETFKVMLSSPYNATLYRSLAMGTILNDDGGNSSNSFVAGGINTTNLAPPELSVKLSPVPARSTMTISLTGFEGKVMLQVFNGDGRQVKQQTVAGSSQQTMDVSALAAGSYVLMVSDEKGNRKTEKFIVSR